MIEWGELFAAVVIIGFTALLWISGINGLRRQRIAVSTRINGAGKTVEYTGRHAIAPSIAKIYIGSLLPLALLSFFLNHVTGRDDMMLFVMLTSAAVAVFAIAVLTSRQRKKENARTRM